MEGQYYDTAETERERLLREASQRLRRLDHMSSRFGLARRILDVGCASGYFVKQASDQGWQATGLDRSTELTKRAREYSGAEVLCGILEDIGLVDGGPYPIVTAWEVLEHTIDPRAFFAALVRNVTAGGLIALSTPLANGVPALVLGDRFPMLTPPEHLSLFTRRSLNLLAGEFGCEEVSYRSFSNLGAKSLASGMTKLLGRAGLGEGSRIAGYSSGAVGYALAWLPRMVDLAGWGTEMETVFRRKEP